MTVQGFTAEFQTFRRLAHEQFGFLFEDYGFAESDARMLSPGMWVEFRNATSQVSVYFEYGGGSSVKVGRVEIVEGRAVPGRQYALHDYVALRAPGWKWKPPPFRFDEEGMKAWLADVAAAVRCCAEDVLRGKFDFLDEVERVQAERARKLYGPRPKQSGNS